MQLPSDPTEVAFESTGKNLKLSSASKAHFNLKEEGKLEILKAKIKGKFSICVSNSLRRRTFKFDSTFEHEFLQRDGKFSFNLKSKSKECTVLSGDLLTSDRVEELKYSLDNLFTKKLVNSHPYESKEILRNSPVINRKLPKTSLPSLKSKENLLSPNVNRKSSLPKPSLNENSESSANPKENTPNRTPKRQSMKNSYANRQPLTIISKSNPKKTTPLIQPTFSFYGKKIPKFMPPPKCSNGKIKPKSLFPSFLTRPFHKYRFGNKTNKETPASTEKVVGFTNLGNTCYMNAILQCLLNIPNFYQELRNQNNIDLVVPESLYNQLGKLGTVKHTQEQEETQRKCLQKVKESISSAAKRFSGYTQHDAHEFLCQCLDQLKEDLSTVVLKQKEEMQLLEEELNTIFTCPIKENFESTVIHSIKCLECHEEVVKKEKYNDFSLVIPELDENFNPSMLTIENLLKLYFAHECIEYSCEKCDSDQSVLSHHFQKLPRVLVLHLKRYDSYETKKSDQVIIPKLLNINNQMSDDTILPKDFKLDNSLWKGTPKSGVKRKLSGSTDNCAPSSKINKLDNKTGEMLAMAARNSRRDFNLMEDNKDKFTRLQGSRSPRKSLFSDKPKLSDPNLDSKDENDNIVQNVTTIVTNDEDAQLKKVLELSMQEYENQQKVELAKYRPTKDSSEISPLSNNAELLKSFDFATSETGMSVDRGSTQTYNLVGIVNHHGLNTASGHYTCDCYDFKSKQWRKYNDSSVDDVDETVVLNERSHSAYIVFYMHSSCFDSIESKF